jgi:hypothetical protein
MTKYKYNFPHDELLFPVRNNRKLHKYKTLLEVNYIYFLKMYANCTNKKNVTVGMLTDIMVKEQISTSTQ